MLHLLCLLTFLAPAHDARAQTSPTGSHPRERTLLQRTWGVEVQFVRRTSAGYMLEFRYRVTDPRLAAPIFDRASKPILTHSESGRKFAVPAPEKTGPLRNSDAPIAGHTYWMFFANPDRAVKPGDHVSIEIGRFRVDGLVVVE